MTVDSFDIHISVLSYEELKIGLTCVLRGVAWRWQDVPSSNGLFMFKETLDRINLRDLSLAFKYN